MLYGQIKPVLVKLKKLKLRYRIKGLDTEAHLRVVAYDMKKVLVANQDVTSVIAVDWEDIILVESEKVMQLPVINVQNTGKTVSRARDKKSIFDSSNAK